MPVTYEDAILTADIMRHRGPGLVDSHIAAAAIRLQAHVVTYNQRDFERTPATLVPIPLSTSRRVTASAEATTIPSSVRAHRDESLEIEAIGQHERPYSFSDPLGDRAKPFVSSS